jgi:hypothetical protein
MFLGCLVGTRLSKLVCDILNMDHLLVCGQYCVNLYGERYDEVKHDLREVK